MSDWLSGNQTVPDTSSGLFAIASVGVVVWTGMLILRQVAPGRWTYAHLACMDLLQIAFMCSALAVGLTSTWLRICAIASIVFYVPVYARIVRIMNRQPVPPGIQRLDDNAGAFRIRARRLYYGNFAFFLATATVIALHPHREMVFALAFLALFGGLQTFGYLFAAA